MKNFLKLNLRIAILFRSYVFFMIICFSLLFMFSCKKDTQLPEKPTIELVADSLCLYADTSLAMGSVMNFKIKAAGERQPLTNFVITYNNVSEAYFLDTGIYSYNFEYDLEVIKGAAAEEIWKFFIMNKDRQTTEVIIKITLDTGGVFGNIKTHNITLGAQNNGQFGSFFSFTEQMVYTLEQAYNNQQTTEMAYCFYTEYESTLSSPNDNDAPSVFTGTYGISNWQIRNEARYNLTTLTGSDFDNVQNDSLMIASYDVVGAKRKGKNIATGQVWAFRIQSGKIGLIDVGTIEAGVNGKVDLRIKIQE